MSNRGSRSGPVLSVGSMEFVRINRESSSVLDEERYILSHHPMAYDSDHRPRPDVIVPGQWTVCSAWERTLNDGEISTSRIIMHVRKRERRMFARISTIQGSPERLEAGRKYFEEHVIPVIETLDGFQGAYFLIDRESGKTVRISLWETEEALRASGEAVTQVRSEGAELMRDWRDPFPGSPVVEEFEVALRR